MTEISPEPGYDLVGNGEHKITQSDRLYFSQTKDRRPGWQNAKDYPNLIGRTVQSLPIECDVIHVEMRK